MYPGQFKFQNKLCLFDFQTQKITCNMTAEKSLYAFGSAFPLELLQGPLQCQMKAPYLNGTIAIVIVAHQLT